MSKACLLGDDGGEVTPVPIPNTEVKLSSADGSWRDTACESRTLPGKEKTKTFSLGLFTFAFVILSHQMIVFEVYCYMKLGKLLAGGGEQMSYKETCIVCDGQNKKGFMFFSILYAWIVITISFKRKQMMKIQILR